MNPLIGKLATLEEAKKGLVKAAQTMEKSLELSWPSRTGWIFNKILGVTR